MVCVHRLRSVILPTLTRTSAVRSPAAFSEGLKHYFTQFGKVNHCLIMRDPHTGRSRGFAFLTFDDPKAVNSVMVKEHFLDGKMVSSARILAECGISLLTNPLPSYIRLIRNEPSHDKKTFGQQSALSVAFHHLQRANHSERTLINLAKCSTAR